jgi:hypothetical protein
VPGVGAHHPGAVALFEAVIAHWTIVPSRAVTGPTRHSSRPTVRVRAVSSTAMARGYSRRR